MNKLTISIILIAVLVLGWFTTASMLLNTEEEVDPEVIKTIEFNKKLAQEQMELNAYGKAIDCYLKVIELEDTIQNHLELAKIYKTAGRITKYKETLRDIMVKYPQNPNAYELLAEYYLSVGDYSDCVEAVNSARTAGLNTNKLTELYFDSAYQYKEYFTQVEEAYRFYKGFSLVKKEGSYYYLNESIKLAMGPYVSATTFVDNYAAIESSDTDNTYFIDLTGEKYLALKDDYSKVESFSEGYAVVKSSNGKYRYLTIENNLLEQEYDYATLFKNGLAAVKNGDKWSVINTAGASTGVAYTDVKYDEENVCSNMGAIFVSEGKGYYIINSSGVRVGTEEFEDAKPFYNSNIAAVKKNGKWGFVDINGNIVIKPQYEDAESFGCDLGAVKIDGKWGYVALDGKEPRIVIEPIFEQAKSFAINKIAPVKKDGLWAYIKLIVE